MGAINGLFATAGAAAGVDPSYFKLLTCFIISYPLGSVFVRIPRGQPALKHAFSIGVTLFFLLGMLELWVGTLHVVGSALFTYIMAANVKGRVMPWTVFGVVMAHLLLSHWVRYMWPSTVVEISGPQMVLTMKLSTFAWNVYDGHQPLESLDESQKETRIPTMPSLLEYFGYVFYFPAFLVGPSLTYSEYTALVNETLFEGARPASPNGTKRVPSGRKRVAYQKLIWGLLAFGFYAVNDGTFNHQVMLTDWWMTKSFLYRVMYIQVIGFVQRTKYYGAWYLTEGACIFTGLGFNGFDKNGGTRWDKAANIDIKNIELCPNFKILLDSWNINTNTWLRNSVYKRLPAPGKKPTGLTTMQTFMTSALWHGIYGGYYLTFFAGGLVSSAARQVRTYVRPFFLPALLPPKSKNLPPPTVIKRIYDIAGTVTSLIILNYVVAPFMLLDFWSSIRAWNTMYWYGHIVVLGWIVWGQYLGGFPMLGRKIKSRVAKATMKEEAEKMRLKLEQRETAFASGAITPSEHQSMMVAPIDTAMFEFEAMKPRAGVVSNATGNGKAY